MLRQNHAGGERRKPRLLSRLCAGVLSASAVSSFGTIACAQDQDSAADVADLQRFDALNERGWAIPHPSVADTLLDDVGGMRSTLADAGVGFYGFSAPNVFQYDLTQSNAGKRVAVNGQVGSWNIANQALSLTFDLGKVGLQGGQLQFNVVSEVGNLQSVNGPDVSRIRNLAYNQILADGAIEIEVGYYTNDIRFLGTQVGGSFAGGQLGPRAVIPFEVGLSFDGFGTPAADIKIKLPSGAYDRAGVQRSLPPGGNFVEARINPNPGLTFAPPGTEPLFIDELGYQKYASANQAATWIRIGGLYNLTKFRNFTNHQGADNWMLYALADRQLTSTSSTQPYRGFYVGASAMYAPPELNLFSQYYEARLYEFGPFDARPGDFTSLVISYETYSREGQKALAPPAFGAFSETTSVIGSYAFHVRPGLYVQPGLGVTTNPSVSRQFNSVLNAYLTLSAFF